MGIKFWNLPPAPREDILNNIAGELNISPLLARILAARGYDSPGKASALLLEGAVLGSPYLIKDMDKAVDRIRRAIQDEESIAVYGDYDCDGITATALMVEYLQSCGANIIYYVPDRETEGYGLNCGAVDFLKAQGVTLVITVDNGVSAAAEIAYAKTLGIDVVVTDHHTPPAVLPGAVAIVNPHRNDCASGLVDLAGVGVAFKLICALEDDLDCAEMLEYCSDLVMIGTVADVVPLTGENRVMVAHGLSNLSQTGRLGLIALLDRSGITGQELTAESVAFTIAPRLNAVGRLGSVDDAIELLLTDDGRYAIEMAEIIDGLNAKRKEVEDCILKEAEAKLAQHPELLRQRLLMIAGEGWHHGVVGIVASRLMEKTGKPALLFSIDEKEARGSARSLPGFSVIEAITACSEHLTRFGGHTLAAGMTLPKDKYNEFYAQMQAFAKENHPLMPLRSIDIDCELAISELGVDNINSISALEPFGTGNKPPQFLLRGLIIDKIIPTSDGKHMRLMLSGHGGSVNAVYFRMTGESFPYYPGDTVDVVAGVTVQVYKGKQALSVIVRDLRLSGVPQEDICKGSEIYNCYLRGEYEMVEDLNLFLPDREDIAVLYRYLKKCPAGFRHGAYQLYYRIMESGISFAKMQIVLDVLIELGLVNNKNDRGEEGFFVNPNPQKADLEDCKILKELRLQALR